MSIILGIFCNTKDGRSAKEFQEDRGESAQRPKRTGVRTSASK